MTAEILKEIPHQKLVKAVLSLCGTAVHSIVSYPAEKAKDWKYVVRFDPNGAQDLVGFVPGHENQDYTELVRIMGILLNLTPDLVIDQIMRKAKNMKSSPLELVVV